MGIFFGFFFVRSEGGGEYLKLSRHTVQGIDDTFPYVWSVNCDVEFHSCRSQSINNTLECVSNFCLGVIVIVDVWVVFGESVDVVVERHFDCVVRL